MKNRAWEHPLYRSCSLGGRCAAITATDSAGAALAPQIGDSIMVLKQPWLGHILSGQKTLEIRSRKHKTGMVWLAEGGQIYGRCNIEAAQKLTIEEFRALEHQHLWPADQDPPYKLRLSPVCASSLVVSPFLAWWVCFFALSHCEKPEKVIPKIPEVRPFWGFLDFD